MAYELMSKINEAEKLCDERIAAAKEKAASIISDAEKKAEELYLQESEKTALQVKVITRAAEDKAQIILQEAEKYAREKTAQLKDSVRSQESAAVLTVTKKLLELA